MKPTCSIRGGVFFLASIHIFYSVQQFILTLPAVVGNLGDKGFESTLAILFCALFFATGFMTFRGVDEASATLIRLGGACLLFMVIPFRFILIGFSAMIIEKIPEATFLYIYDIPALPYIFTIILYIAYLVILLIYYKSLKHQTICSYKHNINCI